MNLDTITKGEELLKKAPGPWNWDANNPNHQLLAFFINHASELLQCAREVEKWPEMKQEAYDAGFTSAQLIYDPKYASNH